MVPSIRWTLARAGAFLLVAAIAAAAFPAFAVGPIDVEAGLSYWNQDLDFSRPASVGPGSSDGSNAFGAHGRFWLGRIGIDGALHRASGGSGRPSADYLNVDLLFRPIKLTDNTYVAFGGGYQAIGVDLAGRSAGSAAGLRLTAEGQIGALNVVSLYGKASWMPRLGDISANDVAGTRFDDLSGREIEAGLKIHPMPFFWIRVGYRQAKLDGDAVRGGAKIGTMALDSKGWLLGAALKF